MNWDKSQKILTLTGNFYCLASICILILIIILLSDVGGLNVVSPVIVVITKIIFLFTPLLSIITFWKVLFPLGIANKILCLFLTILNLSWLTVQLEITINGLDNADFSPIIFISLFYVMAFNSAIIIYRLVVEAGQQE